MCAVYTYITYVYTVSKLVEELHSRLCPSLHHSHPKCFYFYRWVFTQGFNIENGIFRSLHNCYALHLPWKSSESRKEV